MNFYFERLSCNFDYFFKEDKVKTAQRSFDLVLEDLGIRPTERRNLDIREWISPELQAVIEMIALRDDAIAQVDEIESAMKASVQKLPGILGWPNDEYYYRHENVVPSDLFETSLDVRVNLLKQSVDKVLRDPSFYKLPMIAGHHSPYGEMAEGFPYELFLVTPVAGQGGLLHFDWNEALKWIDQHYAGEAGLMKARSWAAKRLISRFELSKATFDNSKGKVTISTSAGWGTRGIQSSIMTLCALKVAAMWSGTPLIEIESLREAVVKLVHYNLEPGVICECGKGLQVRLMKGELRLYLSSQASDMLRLFIGSHNEQ